jgi:drug/metabolite transporter (DMT)-like permease
VLGVGLALFSAFLFALSSAMQQHEVSATAESPSGRKAFTVRLSLPVLRLFKRLFTDKLFLIGTAANVVGSLVQAAALHFTSLATVQLIFVTELVFALPLGGYLDRAWPGGREWLGSLAISGGLVVFFLVPGVQPAEGQPDMTRAAIATTALLIASVVLVISARKRTNLAHTLMIAVAAGLCYANSAMLLKITLNELLNQGVPATAADWPGYVLILTNVGGFVAEQEAFAGGSLAAAFSVMTVTNPIASYLLGVYAFGSTVPTTIAAWAALSGAGTLVIAGVVILANSPMVRAQMAKSPESERARSTGEVTRPAEAS